jgi:hypothetical protein
LINFNTAVPSAPEQYIYSSTNRIKISWPISGPKTNLAEAHQDKTPATQLKRTTNVMALRTKIQTFSRKQDFNIQMHIKAEY